MSNFKTLSDYYDRTKRDYSIPEPSHLTGVEWITFDSKSTCSNRLEIDTTNKMAAYTWLPAESFFTFKFTLTDGKGRPVNSILTRYAGIFIRDELSASSSRVKEGEGIFKFTSSGRPLGPTNPYYIYDWKALKSWKAKPGSGGYYIPLISVFNTVDTLVENVKVELNGQEICLESSDYYHREAAFRKILRLDPDQENLSRPRERDDYVYYDILDSETRGLIRNATFTHDKPWFTDSIARRLVEFPMCDKEGGNEEEDVSTKLTAFWKPEHRLFTDTTDRCFPSCRLKMTIQLIKDLRYCIQRNPYTNVPANGADIQLLDEDDYKLKFDFQFDSLRFHACVLNSPREITRAHNPAVDATLYSHLTQIAGLQRFSFHNKIRCYLYDSEQDVLKGNQVVIRFDTENDLRRIWLQSVWVPPEVGNAKLGVVDWKGENPFYGYVNARCNYFLDSDWDYSNTRMGRMPNEGGELAWRRYSASVGGVANREDFMQRFCALTWAYDADKLNRYRINLKQVVNYKVEFKIKTDCIRGDPANLQFNRSKYIFTYGPRTSKIQTYVWTLQSEAITWANQMGEAGAFEIAPMAEIATYPGVQNPADLMSLSRDYLIDGMYGRSAKLISANRIGPR